MKRTFKIYILSAAFLLGAVGMNAQVADFEKYAKAEGTTYAYISQTMLELIENGGSVSVPGMDMAEFAGRLTSMQIINCDTEQSCGHLKSDVADIVKAQKYELLMQTSEEGLEADIYIKEGKKSSVLILEIDSGDTVCCIVIAGNFSAKDMLEALDKSTLRISR